MLLYKMQCFLMIFPCIVCWLRPAGNYAFTISFCCLSLDCSFTEWKGHMCLNFFPSMQMNPYSYSLWNLPLHIAECAPAGWKIQRRHSDAVNGDIYIWIYFTFSGSEGCTRLTTLSWFWGFLTIFFSNAGLNHPQNFMMSIKERTTAWLPLGR